MVASRPQPGRPLRAFFTGTPISNSLAELYVLMTYLMPGRLGELRIDSFDAFAGMFIEFKTQIEVAPDGGSFGCTAVRPTSQRPRAAHPAR